MRGGWRVFVGVVLSVVVVHAGMAEEPAVVQPSVAAGDKTVPDMHPATQKAEYAFRWRVSKRGLTSAADTTRWLQEHASLEPFDPEKALDVAYFTVAQPEGLPKGYEATLRRRGIDDFTYKVRGPAPASARLSAAACNGLKLSDEWDISLMPSGAIAKRSASLSCDGAPENFASLITDAAAQLRPCKISMQRTEMKWKSHDKKVKIEQWTFTPRHGRTDVLLEVSWKGKASESDEAAFRNLVSGIPASPSKGAPPSKEKFAAQCDARSR